MRPYIKLIYFLSIAFLASNPISSTSAMGDNIRLTKPEANECLKAGSTYDVQWTPGINTEINDLNDHYALSFSSDGSTYPLPQNDFIGDDGVSYIIDDNSLIGTRSSWTIPSITTNQGMLYLEYHIYGGKSLTPYHYRVYPEAGNGSFSKTGPFSIDNSGPTKPTLNIKSKTETSVALSWTDSIDEGCKELAGYKVYRDNKLIATQDSDKKTYEDVGLNAGRTYSYKVSAFDDFTSTDSTIIKATTNKPSEPVSSAAEDLSPSIPNNPTIIRFGNTNYDSSNLNPSVPQIILGENIHLEGTAAPGTMLVLTIHSKEQTFETKADNTGKWQYDISTKDLETGSHTITLAYKDNAGMTGTVKEIAKFSLVASDPLPDTVIKKSFPIWGWAIILLTTLLITGGTALLLIKRRKKLQESNNSQNVL